MTAKNNYRNAISQALQRGFGGNMTEMAKVCGVARMTLFRHLRGSGKIQSKYTSEEAWAKLELWAGRYDRARRVPIELGIIVECWGKLSESDKNAVSSVCRAIAATYPIPVAHKWPRLFF